MKKEQNTHGGAGRGQGRKPLDPESETIGVTLKMTRAQREKLARLGGAAWVRNRIDRAKEPTEE